MHKELQNVLTTTHGLPLHTFPRGCGPERGGLIRFTAVSIMRLAASQGHCAPYNLE